MSVTNTAVTPSSPECPGSAPLTAVLDRIANKWAIMVIGALSKGPMRFNAMARHIEGVSQRMLTLTLRNLEKDGLVTRTVYPTIPPRVEYELTKLGRTLIGPLTVLYKWAQANTVEMEAARAAYDARHKDE
ncbi:winged helix-turn-helix transcriptional regulator [Massilia sp.]|uniref:winged helix-turn-helix transcriptional regulator n=1 Tax=Massilia sp. TaxID=1882437 RepID=UPI0039171C93